MFKCKIIVLGRADTNPNWKVYVDAKWPLNPLLMLFGIADFQQFGNDDAARLPSRAGHDDP
jgi:hypothetical protein